MLLNESDVATRTGEIAQGVGAPGWAAHWFGDAEAAIPRSPSVFEPQQYTLPSDVSPHALFWFDDSFTNVRPPATATGPECGELSAGMPAPSCPNELLPQQYAAPVVLRPHVRNPEALTDENVIPGTNVGIGWHVTPKALAQADPVVEPS